MKKIITYGTYDMFHNGHFRLLKRAKEEGAYLIVGVTSEDYDRSRGKINVVENTEKRVAAIKDLDFVDEVIIETHKGQKEIDIQKYDIDKFVIGDDWLGHFDYLNEYCQVVYLPRTPGISSTLLRESMNHSINVGIIGTGRIANRFAIESKKVDNISVVSVLSSKIERVNEFIKEHKLHFGYTSIEQFLSDDDKINAVYIASKHETHYMHAKMALLSGKHVLCEKPAVLKKGQIEELIKLAREKDLVYIEAIKTAFSPAFNNMLAIAKTKIGSIQSTKATFTKIFSSKTGREFLKENGGSTLEFGSYVYLLSTKLFGKHISFDVNSVIVDNVETSTFSLIKYNDNKIAQTHTSITHKAEGDAIISGDKGYIYIPAPWWKTDRFYVRYENSNIEEKYEYDIDPEGLIYEISEFISLINKKYNESTRLTDNDMIFLNNLMLDVKQNI